MISNRDILFLTKYYSVIVNEIISSQDESCTFFRHSWHAYAQYMYIIYYYVSKYVYYYRVY